MERQQQRAKAEACYRAEYLPSMNAIRAYQIPCQHSMPSWLRSKCHPGRASQMPTGDAIMAQQQMPSEPNKSSANRACHPGSAHQMPSGYVINKLHEGRITETAISACPRCISKFAIPAEKCILPLRIAVPLASYVCHNIQWQQQQHGQHEKSATHATAGKTYKCSSMQMQ